MPLHTHCLKKLKLCPGQKGGREKISLSDSESFRKDAKQEFQNQTSTKSFRANNVSTPCRALSGKKIYILKGKVEGRGWGVLLHFFVRKNAPLPLLLPILQQYKLANNKWVGT